MVFRKPRVTWKSVLKLLAGKEKRERGFTEENEKVFPQRVGIIPGSYHEAVLNSYKIFFLEMKREAIKLNDQPTRPVSLSWSKNGRVLVVFRKMLYVVEKSERKAISVESVNVKGEICFRPGMKLIFCSWER